jgi:hypothetical protein
VIYVTFVLALVSMTFVKFGCYYYFLKSNLHNTSQNHGLAKLLGQFQYPYPKTNKAGVSLSKIFKCSRMSECED